MKKILTIITIVVLSNLFVYTQSGWNIQQPIPQGYSLMSIYFTDYNTGYVFGRGIIFKTTDGGTNWSQQPTEDLNFNVNSFYFINADTGYAVDKGTIYKTTNAGINWTEQYKVDDVFLKYWTLHAIYFINADTGYAVGGGMTNENSIKRIILKTTDGGANWIYKTLMGEELHSVYFIDADTGYAVGEGENILKTTNGGNNWSIQNEPTNIWGINILYSVYFINSDTGYAVGGGCGYVEGSETILKTTNGGTTWLHTNHEGIKSDLYSVYFTDANTGYAVGAGGLIYKSTDGGEHWESQNSGTSNWLNSVYFTEANTGYAVGGDGIILKTNTGGVPSIINLYTTTSENNLHIYPNPCDGNFAVEFDNSSKKMLQISIIDLSGKILFETLSNLEKYEYFGELLPAGFYILKVKSDKVNFGKIIVR